LNPTLGSIFASQQGLASDGYATITLTQQGSNFDGSITFAGTAPGSIQFVTSPGFAVDYFSTCVSDCVSTVPLPPALPLFASALLVLGTIGLCKRTPKKQQQSYRR